MRGDSRNDGTALNPQGRAVPDEVDMTNIGRQPLNLQQVNSRKEVRIGTWNVRTLNQAGKVDLLEKELIRCKVNIMGLAETKWKGDEGHFYATEGSMVITGKNDKKQHGVGFIIDKKTATSVMGYEATSNRVMAVRLASAPMNIFQYLSYNATLQQQRMMMMKWKCSRGRGVLWKRFGQSSCMESRDGP